MVKALASLCCCWLSAGCGSQTYETRLNDTVQYLRYKEKLDKNLERTIFRGSGLELRVPLGFKLVPPPETAASADAPDSRLPSYVSGGFPGLVGAWQKDVRVPGRGEGATMPCDLFIIGNYDMYRDPALSPQAGALLDTAIDRILTGLGVVAEQQEKLEWPEMQIPPQKGYVVTKAFRKASVQPEKLVNGSKADIDIYYTKSPKEQLLAMVMIVAPAGVSAAEALHERIPLCLETLVVADSKPERAASSSGAAAKPKVPGF
jgi:hypothetical protein